MVDNNINQKLDSTHYHLFEKLVICHDVRNNLKYTIGLNINPSNQEIEFIENNKKGKVNTCMKDRILNTFHSNNLWSYVHPEKGKKKKLYILLIVDIPQMNIDYTKNGYEFIREELNDLSQVELSNAYFMLMGTTPPKSGDNY